MNSAPPGTIAAPSLDAVGLIRALGRGLPESGLVVDPDVLAAISHDEAEWAPVGRAVAGVRARTEAEVRHVVRACAEFGAPGPACPAGPTRLTAASCSTCPG